MVSAKGRTRKKDANQPQIEKELRHAGFSVVSTHMVASGFPDIVVGLFGVNFLFEIKADKKSKLTSREAEFSASWKGQCGVVTTSEEVINSIKIQMMTTLIHKNAILDFCDSSFNKIQEYRDNNEVVDDTGE